MEEQQPFLRLYICERLDRAVADAAWCTRHSDHQPVIVSTVDRQAPRRHNAKPSFRFEAGWIYEEECEVVVENAWKLTVEAREGKVTDAMWEVAAELLD